MKVLELFSGMGSQIQALSDADIKYQSVGTCDWDIGAIYAYDILHHGKQTYVHYDNETKEELIKRLNKYTLSNNNKVLTEQGLRRKPIELLRRVIYAIERTNNYCNIKEIQGDKLPAIDLLTYSFPCQDLSTAGFFKTKNDGITKGSGTRSSLLWEVGRILEEINNTDNELPKFLIMENVPAILHKENIDNFKLWQNDLQKLGYYNHVYSLYAHNFGVPQSRQRVFMLSVKMGTILNKSMLTAFFNTFNNRIDQQVNIGKLTDYLKLDYDNPIYKFEADQSNPNFTINRKKINKISKVIYDGTSFANACKTILTEPDKYPNAGIIKYPYNVKDGKAPYRHLTARECFLLMGFTEDKYNLLLDNNFFIDSSRYFFNKTRLHKLAGNAIVVPVLVAIFRQIEILINIETFAFKCYQKRIESTDLPTI